MENNLRTLGPREAELILSLRSEEREIVSTSDIAERLGSPVTARNVIQSLVQKGWLTRLVRGRYLVIPPEYGPEAIGENNILALASAIVDKSYVGWWAAAAFHKMTTQRPMAVSVATLKQMRPRILEGSEVRFVTITERKFFGQQDYELYGRRIVVSDPAKTLVDCADRPDLCGGPAELARIVFGGSTEIQVDDLLDAARRMSSGALAQRLGYLMDLVGWRTTDRQRSALQKLRRPSDRAYLGRKHRGSDDIGYVAEWGLFVHAQASELLADVPSRVRAS